MVFFGAVSLKYEQKESNIQGEIMYYILVDRFNNGDHANDQKVNVQDPASFHGGDLKGIIEKLDDLEALGVTTLVLSPIMQNAPKGYHGYWTEDITKIDPSFGTESDWQQLVNRAQVKNMKIVVAFAPSYIAKSSPIAKDPKKQAWYKPVAPAGGESWKQNVYELDLGQPEVQQYVKEAGLAWLQKGADGFLLKDADRLPTAFLTEFREYLKVKHPAFYLLAEFSGDASPDQQLLQADAVLNPATQKQLAQTFEKVDKPLRGLPADAKAILSVDDQEMLRFAQAAGENGRNAATAWKLALTYLYGAKGTPMLYQGSELPMYGKALPDIQKLVEFNSGDPKLQEYFERLGALRKQFSVFSDGDFEQVGSEAGMTVYKRSNKEETVYIAINNDSNARAVTVHANAQMQLDGLLGDNIVREDKEGSYTITLPRETAEIYVLEKDKGINWPFIGFIIGVIAIFIIAVLLLSRKQKKRAGA